MTKQALINDHVETKKLVLECLENDTRCRNSDLWLILNIWVKMQKIELYVNFDQLGEMIIPESITRARREIQHNENKLLPTDPSVLVRRSMKENAIRSYYADNQKILNEWINLKYRVR